MPNWLEEALEKAAQDGLFDNLPGAGKPLNLTQNPFENPNDRLTHRVIKQSGATLPWIEERQTLMEDIEKARQKLKKTWDWYSQQPAPTTQPGWQRAVTEFQTALLALNKRIRDFNLKAPIASTYLAELNLERELEKILN